MLTIEHIPVSVSVTPCTSCEVTPSGCVLLSTDAEDLVDLVSSGFTSWCVLAVSDAESEAETHRYVHEWKEAERQCTKKVRWASGKYFIVLKFYMISKLGSKFTPGGFSTELKGIVDQILETVSKHGSWLKRCALRNSTGRAEYYCGPTEQTMWFPKHFNILTFSTVIVTK